MRVELHITATEIKLHRMLGLINIYIKTR